MNRIAETFKALKRSSSTAFIGFLTAGDPDLKTCKKLLLEMAHNGCDVIEIGVPFSDPIAEGPMIQAASLRALQHGICSDDIMNMVKELRDQILQPLLYLLYYNQIFKYGIEEFFCACQKSGIDGVIVPDLPYEHQAEITSIAKAHEVQVISLVTPISAKRKERIAKASEGFLYCVTSLGVTGERSQFTSDLQSFIQELNLYTDTPKALGFGISTVEQIKEMKNYADGIIVGSAIVRKIADIANGTGSVEQVGSFVKKLADACHGIN